MITLQEAAAFFMASAARCEAELTVVVATVVADAAERAKGFIGSPQTGWPMAWAELSSATVEGFRHPTAGWIPGKQELGYGGYESPLLRTGDMRDSIEFNVMGLWGEVGSNDKKALYQELGTPGALFPTPPRPFLAKGMMDAAYTIEPLCEAVAASLLAP